MDRNIQRRRYERKQIEENIYKKRYNKKNVYKYQKRNAFDEV